MKKIAFLFLTLENPNFPKIWNKYFRGHKDKYTIYIHAKYPEKVTWKKKHIIKDLQETAWGYITRALIELLKEAYKDTDNYKFVTISESCIPIKSFDDFYHDAILDPCSWIKKMNISKYNYQERIGKTISKSSNKIIPKYFLKNYARFCLNRTHVMLLLQKSEELKFFHNMHVGDEFFLTVLYPLKNVRDFAVTYDDWEYVDIKKKEIKDKIRSLYEIQEKNHINKSDEILKKREEFNNIAKNPKTIINVEDDLEKIKSCDSYFYRKFAKNSNIEKYWNGIIKK
jgi:hypothetical protein